MDFVDSPVEELMVFPDVTFKVKSLFFPQTSLPEDKQCQVGSTSLLVIVCTKKKKPTICGFKILKILKWPIILCSKLEVNIV